MRVVCSQFHDGGKESEYEVAPPVFGMSPWQIINAKADSHAEKGWEVVWHGNRGFTAKKVYPDGRWAKVRTRKFRLEH